MFAREHTIQRPNNARIEMKRKLKTGACEHCDARFGYFLVHNGFNESSFAYCDGCGRTALLSAWFDDIPDDAALYHYGPVSVEAEPWLESCECGGAFRANASPRCRGCNCKLSAQEARSWIEANAPGTAKGWRWQGGWHGLYCISKGVASKTTGAGDPDSPHTTTPV